jgi:energy-coupling factor transport system ATP-binding protein
LQDVSYSYPLPGAEEAPALSGIDIEVMPGEILCVAGPNGSGKSTLAQVCAGLVVPTAGRLLFDGDPVEGRAALRGLRKKVGLVFQSPEDQLFADTVRKDISFGPRNHGLRGPELERRVEEAAAVVDLPLDELGARSPFSLSGGEMRRAALAGVLALQPRVLVLDEPFIGLDHDGREHLRAALERYRKNRETSVLIVTHDLGDSWRIADRFALLSKGNLIRLEQRRELVSGRDLSTLGMQLPQWGVLARELASRGMTAEDPADPAALAGAIAARLEATDGR